MWPNCKFHELTERYLPLAQPVFGSHKVVDCRVTKILLPAGFWGRNPLSCLHNKGELQHWVQSDVYFWGLRTRTTRASQGWTTDVRTHNVHTLAAICCWEAIAITRKDVTPVKSSNSQSRKWPWQSPWRCRNWIFPVPCFLLICIIWSRETLR